MTTSPDAQPTDDVPMLPPGHTHGIGSYRMVIGAGIIVIAVAFALLNVRGGTRQDPQIDSTVSPTPTMTPTPTPVMTFVQPRVDVQDVYEVILVGDSMTAALGPHGGPFSEYLNTLYGESGIIVDNYSVPSSNIQSLQKRFTEQFTNVDGELLLPIRDRKDADLIIIESFAYNPLSHLTAEEAVTEHERELHHFLEVVATELPRTRVALMTTVAPDWETFARRSQQLNAEQSRLQAEERIRYLLKHQDLGGMYALPVINVFAASLSPQGDGDSRYINPDDNIHPSVDGIELISRTMSNFIYHQSILPVPR